MLGTGDTVWVRCVATIMSIRFDPIVYPACNGDYNGRTCQKKMGDQGDGSWCCERCGSTAPPTWRYLLNLSVSDFTGRLEGLSAFGETGEAVMDGMTATRAHEVRCCCGFSPGFWVFFFLKLVSRHRCAREGRTGEGARVQLSSEDDEAFNRAIGHIFHQTKSFKIKCAEDTYNDEKRVKYTIQACDPVDWGAECKVRFTVDLWLISTASALCVCV